MLQQKKLFWQLFFLFSSCIFIFPANSFAQALRFIARGADPDELYITTYWYNSPNQLDGWGGIFRSTDNGLTMSLKHKYRYYQDINEIYADSLGGTIYLQHYAGLDTLLVSHDYGVTYIPKRIVNIGYTQMASGCRSGEFYSGYLNINNPGLTRFTLFGDSAQVMNLNADSIHLRDVGTTPGELYATLWPYYSYFEDTLGIAYSNNYGQTFSIIYQDTCLLWNMQYLTFSRGTCPGELYITAQDTIDRYHIFHSADHGQTLELKSITQPIPVCCEDVSFTAGRAPGSFYMLRSNAYSYDHADVWIYYSSDYGATFTSYYHSLDSTYTGMPAAANPAKGPVYPNPAGDKVTFGLDAAAPGEFASVELYNLLGKPAARKVTSGGQTEISLDTKGLAPGSYFYRIRQSARVYTGRIILVR